MTAAPINFNQWGNGPEPRKEVDFEAVKHLSLSNAEYILSKWQPGGRIVRGEYICGDMYGGNGNSCSTKIATGVGADFASDRKWGDLIDLVAQIENCSMSDAARKIADELGSDPNRPLPPGPQLPRQTPEDRYENGKRIATALWMESNACPNQHPYLIKKGVSADPGIRAHAPTGNILIPLYDPEGNFWSVQRVSPDGEKKINQDGKMGGNFFLISGERDVVYVCEGYATAATVAQITRKTAVMAVNAGNLAPVASSIAKMFPTADLVIAADNDNDKTDGTNPGIKAAESAVSAAGKGRVVAPPATPGEKVDWNDYATKHGAEAAAKLLLTEGKRGVRVDRWGMSAYQGKNKPIEWIVENVLPRGKAALLTAPGDSGKGMLTLDLALQVAAGVDCLDLNDGAGWWGNKITGRGKVVIFSAEDDKDELHRRIENMDPTGELRDRADGRLFVIPLPNDGGPIPLVVNGPNGVQASAQYYEILEQLRSIDDLALVNFDPLASFCTADINADPQVGAYMTGLMASMAIEINASVVVAHHMNKSKEAILSPEQARNAIRGTTAIVDGMRVALGMWAVDERKARAVCQAINIEYKRALVFEGAVVKANGPADRETKTLVRTEYGLLKVRDAELRGATLRDEDLMVMIESDIRRAAELGRPFTVAGNACLFQRREELNAAVRCVDKGRMERMTRRLVEDAKVVRATYKGGLAKFLDVPSGKFALGEGLVASGFESDKNNSA